MANIIQITKAKVYQTGIYRALGVLPELDIQENHVRIFYPPDKLKEAQNNFKKIMKKKQSDIRLDIGGVMTPHLIKSYGKIAFGALLFSFVLGKLTK